MVRASRASSCPSPEASPGGKAASRSEPCRGGRVHLRRLRAAGALALAAAALLATAAAAATTTRTEDQRLARPGPVDAGRRFGNTVAMGEGLVYTRGLVGMPFGGLQGGGAVHHYVWNGAIWQWVDNDTPPPIETLQPFPMDDAEGFVVTAVEAPDGTTAIKFFSPTGNLFSPLDVSYGSRIEAVAYRGSLLALGLPSAIQGHGLIVIYQFGPSGWEYVNDLVGSNPGDRMGSALAWSDTLLVAGAPAFGANGAVYLYVCCDAFNEWVEWQRIDSPADSQTGADFGAALDVTDDNDWIAVGSPLLDRVNNPGAAVDVGGVYLYQHVGTSWQLDGLRRPGAAGDRFGTSVAIHRKALVVGAPREDFASGDEGAAYVYHLEGDEWEATPRLRLVDSAAGLEDELGTSVAAGDLGVFVGSDQHDVQGVADVGAVLFYRDAAAFFADGFESGGASGWGWTTP